MCIFCFRYHIFLTKVLCDFLTSHSSVTFSAMSPHTTQYRYNSTLAEILFTCRLTTLLTRQPRVTHRLGRGSNAKDFGFVPASRLLIETFGLFLTNIFRKKKISNFISVHNILQTNNKQLA
jgi:hypothetical protein